MFEIIPGESVISFSVKTSVALERTFEKWNATLTFRSTDPTTGVLDVKIEAASVNTGSGMKDGKLRSEKFFDVKNDPYIKFHATKVTQTGPTTFEVPGKFTMRGVSKPEALTFPLTAQAPSQVGYRVREEKIEAYA